MTGKQLALLWPLVTVLHSTAHSFTRRQELKVQAEVKECTCGAGKEACSKSAWALPTHGQRYLSLAISLYFQRLSERSSAVKIKKNTELDSGKPITSSCSQQTAQHKTTAHCSLGPTQHERQQGGQEALESTRGRTFLWTTEEVELIVLSSLCIMTSSGLLSSRTSCMLLTLLLWLPVLTDMLGMEWLLPRLSIFLLRFDPCSLSYKTRGMGYRYRRRSPTQRVTAVPEVCFKGNFAELKGFCSVFQQLRFSRLPGLCSTP